MSDWRKRLSMTRPELQELSADSMAATRIMRGLGASARDIGKLCSRFGLEYREDDTSFSRAVNIFREVYPEARLIDFMDVKTGVSRDALFECLMNDARTGIIFHRWKGISGMTSYIKGLHLSTSPIGSIVIKPGIRYVLCKNDIQLWEQDPVTLIQSFSKVAKEE